MTSSEKRNVFSSDPPKMLYFGKNQVEYFLKNTMHPPQIN